MRVVQLNVDSLVGPRWPERRHEIVTWLDELNADVVCLQEIWQDHRHPNTGGWIAEHAAGDWHWEFGGFAPPDPDAVGADPSLRFGSAILSRWPFDAVELMSLPVSRDERGPIHLTSGPRRCRPVCRSSCFTSVRPGSTCTAHTFSHCQRRLPPRPAGAVHRRRHRTHMRSVLIDAAHPLRGLQRGAHVGRDPVPHRERGHRRAEHVLSGRVGGDPRTRRHDLGPRERSRTLESNEPPKRIDYVFVGESCLRPDGAGRVMRASLAFNERRTGTFASDHYGLSVDIVWPTRPSMPNDRRP